MPDDTKSATAVIEQAVSYYVQTNFPFAAASLDPYVAPMVAYAMEALTSAGYTISKTSPKGRDSHDP